MADSSGHDVAVIWEADSEDGDPDSQRLVDWAIEVLQHQQVAPSELAIKVVAAEESQALNRDYRSKDAPTNVLSFPSEAQDIPIPLLGDLALCAPVIRAEAQQQNKSFEAHYAHMVVHGVLHLLGYDHIEEQEAEQMEQIERNILRTMGFGDPYLEVG